MGYWFFMLAMNLLLPAIMIISGGYFMKKAPKEINYVFGYRTNMSMKNKDGANPHEKQNPTLRLPMLQRHYRVTSPRERDRQADL